MKIAVVCGGISSEREVSLSSGKMIAAALAENGHEVALLDLSADAPLGLSFARSESVFSAELGKEMPKKEIGEGVLEFCKQSDVVFAALHGGAGEDGRFQAALELNGIKHTGPSFLGCAVAMDKELSKTLMQASGIAVPKGIACCKGKIPSLEHVPFPCVVKPNRGGSSVGVSFAKNEAELKAALENAFLTYGKVIIEEKLVGRELTVGVLNGKALPAVEIKPKQGFYDYKNKYIKGLTDEICPAPLSESEASGLASAAVAAAKALRLDSYCRADFIFSGGTFYCLEVNALPGMTQTSLLPLEAEAVGLSFNALCEEILRIAAEDAAVSDGQNLF